MKKTIALARRYARYDGNILIEGESGTGKELFAQAMHNEGSHADGPFVAINCASIPRDLLERELFGYEEGAFTGARKGGRPGLFELAHQGTLFLDEVEGMSPALQVKMLRVLQEREIMRVGGSRIVSVDVRIVAATNENLSRRVAEGSFRRDLFYRLNTLPVQVPPLSCRGDDVFLLLEHFRRELGGTFTLSEPVQDFFRRYSWPGNIRELRNVAEYFLYTGHDCITLEDLPSTVLEAAAPCPPPEEAPEDDGAAFVLEQLYRASERGESLGRERLLSAAREGE